MRQALTFWTKVGKASKQVRRTNSGSTPLGFELLEMKYNWTLGSGKINLSAMGKKILRSLVLFFGILFIWFFHLTSSWKPKDPSLAWTSFDYLKSKNGSYSTAPESAALALKCVGFEGECNFPELGLRLKLRFSGFRWAKPTYTLFNLMGGSTGFSTPTNYYGERVLEISKLDGAQIAEFRQFLWNTPAYSDFSQILYFDLAGHRLLVSALDGFFGVQDLGYPVPF